MTAVGLHQQRLARIRRATASALVDRWDTLGNYDRPSAEPFARTAAPIVAAGQLLAARTTVAYLSRRRGQPVELDRQAVTAARRGADPVDTYQRPFGAVWAALAAGVPWVDAVAQGRARLAQLAVTDVQLATRATYDTATAQSPVTSWVRVADAGACDLCAADDGATYATGGDMPIHPGCGCSLEPVLDDTSSSAKDPEVFDVHDHDELGPVLYAAGDHFAGP